MKTFYGHSINMELSPVLPITDNPPDLMAVTPVKPIRKRIRHVGREDTVALPTDHLTFISTSSHTLPQLKYLCRQFKLKVTGNKSELKEYIRVHLARSWSARIIQKAWQTFMQRQWSVCRGPARFQRHLCINTTDFCTMEDLKNQPFHRFFSYCDKDQKIYGFDLLSFYNLYHMPSTTRYVMNPYNREQIPNAVYRSLLRLVNFGKLLYNDDITVDNDPVEADMADDLNEDIILDEEIIVVTPAQFTREIHLLFRAIDDLGNYSDPDWILELERSRLLKFLRDLNDIWSHRANLRIQVKRDISPNGHPFFLADADMGDLEYYEIDELQAIVLKVIKIFVHDGVNNESRMLGAMYVLGALTLVSHSAAIALPWLYESFI